MATYNWSGGFGQYSEARHWDPHGVPGKGDTAMIAQGEVVLCRQDVQATVSIGGTDASAPPVLDLRNASMGTVTAAGNPYVFNISTPDASGLPSPPGTEAGSNDPAFSSPAVLVPVPGDLPQPAPEYAVINALGESSIRNLDVGGLFVGPAETDVNLGGNATLSATFLVGNGSTLNVHGDDSSSFNVVNAESISAMRGGRVVLDAPVAGQGTIFMDGPYVPGLLVALPVGFISHAASLELGSSVGSDITIAIRAGDLQIDNPMAFQGRIDLLASPTMPSILNIDPAGPQSVTLEGMTATSFSFDDSSHVMTLFNGSDVVDRVGFTPDITTGSFMPASSGGSESSIGVAQTASGVFLSHLPASALDGSTVIPMQT